MKRYIKPEVKVYKVRIESLLCGSEGGQIGCGFAPKRDFFSVMRKMVTDILVAAIFWND